MFAYAHANRCVLREVSNDYTTDSRQHTRLGRPKRQPANSTAEEEKPPPKSAPARKKAVEVLGCAARDERETYVTKAPKTISCAPGSHAKDPATCTDRTCQRAAEQVDTRVLGSQGAARGRDARGGWMQGCMARGQHACGTLQSFVCCAGRQKGSGHCSGAREILMGGELSPATRRRTRGAHRGSAICIGENETSPAVPAVGTKILARSWAWTG